MLAFRKPIGPNRPAVLGFAKAVAAALFLLLHAAIALAENEAPAEQRLRLVADKETMRDSIAVEVMKPFEAWIVGERVGEKQEISTVVFSLELPDGLLLVGEELLEESLIVLGTPKTGMHLTFHCQTGRVAAMHLRFVATKPLGNAVIRLMPEPKNSFRGLVTGRSENFGTLATPEHALHITMR
jgi:hypothetical protein